MKFYVIPPVSNLDLMLQGDSIFILAHLYLKHPKYKEFALQCAADGRWVTLDNSAAERCLVTEDVLLDIVKELKPSEVIPPDYLFDKCTTLNFLSSFVAKMKREDLLKDTQILFCPQGKTKQDWIDCYIEGLNHPDVTTIGMSKIAVPFAFMGAKDDDRISEARNLCYDELRSRGLIQKPMHFLGMGHPYEFRYYKNEPLARSTDSCYSVLSAICSFDWHKGEFIRTPTPHTYFDKELTTQQLQLALSNIFYFRQLLNT